MSVYKNNDPAQGYFVVSPAGKLVFHEASQKVKPGYREAEQSDIDAASDAELQHCGYKPRVAQPEALPSNMPPVVVRATGTIE